MDNNKETNKLFNTMSDTFYTFNNHIFIYQFFI